MPSSEVVFYLRDARKLMKGFRLYVFVQVHVCECTNGLVWGWLSRLDVRLGKSLGLKVREASGNKKAGEDLLQMSRWMQW